MNDYFNDVYLWRINRFGTTLQERILNKKEYDFHHFVKKSPNKVTVYIQDYQFEGVLQSKTYNEIETIDYFLTYKTIPIPNGSILKVQSIKDNNSYSYWIVVTKDNFVSAGYNRYTVIKLDREIQWITEEGLIFKALVHISGSGSGGTNHRLISATKITNESVVYMPNQVLTIVMQDHEEVQRGRRITIGNQVWKISGYDNVTNDGVCYVTLEQDYFDKSQDKITAETQEDKFKEDLADSTKIERWNFDTSIREDVIEGKRWIKIKEGETVPIDFYASYFDKISNAECIIKIQNREIVKYSKSDRTLTGVKVGKTEIEVSLKDTPDIKTIFYIEVLSSSADFDTFSVEGAARLKYGIPSIFTSTIPFELETEKDSIIVKNLGQIVKNEQQLYALEITISELIKNLTLNFIAENDQTYSKDIAVESPWIGG